jgi:hypothetical protein
MVGFSFEGRDSMQSTTPEWHRSGNLAPTAVINGSVADRITLSSSVIASIAYDAPAKTLEVEFGTGRVYLYLDVPQSEFEALTRAPSAGAYFNREIRDRYAFREIA